MPNTEHISIEQMRSSAGAAIDLLSSLNHQDRLLLLCQLCQQEMCVSELEEALDIHQPSLSQQLGVLRRKGLITPRRDGKHIYYHVNDPKVLAILNALYDQFCH